METSRRAAMAGSVFLVALATGYVMQNGDAVASRFVADEELAAVPRAVQVAGLSVAAPKGDIAIPEEPKLVALSTPAPEAFSRAPLPDDGLVEVRLEPGEGLGPFGVPCGISLTATPAPAAMVHLSLEAACHGGQPVTLRHGALTFTEVTGTDGHLDVVVPALAASAAFQAQFLDGASARAETDVSDAANYERVALQWQGDTGLGLHAFEFGAGYGEPGHVHLGAAHSPDRAIRSGAGYLTRLGSDAVPGGWVTEVYSLPADAARTPDAVRITFEAEITDGNCGRELSAQTLQMGAGSGFDVAALTLAVPTCEAVGEFLVLDNLVRDVELAAN